MSTSPVGSKTTASSQAAPAPSDKAAASKKLPYPTQVVKTPTAKKVGSLQRRATIVNDDTLKAFFKSQEEKNTSEPSETRARSNSEAGVRGSINLDNVAALPVSDIAKYTAMTWQEKLEELGFAHLDKMSMLTEIRQDRHVSTPSFVLRIVADT